MKGCRHLFAVAGLLALAGTTQAGSPGFTLLLLPQLFGQESPQTKPSREQNAEVRDILVRVQDTHSSVATPKEDDNSLANLILESGFQLFRLSTSCGRQQCAVDLVAWMISRVAGIDSADVPDEGVITNGPVLPCPKECPAGSCEVLPHPKAIRVSSCKSDSPCEAPCTKCKSESAGCALVLGFGVADACTIPLNCPMAAKACVAARAAAKACKCCENCKDCKDCTCARSTGVNSSGVCGSIVLNERNYSVQPCPPAVVVVHPGHEHPFALRFGADYRPLSVGSFLSAPVRPHPVTAKACKCCEDCKDCKDCTCAKTTGVTSSRGVCGSIVFNERNYSVNPCETPAVPSTPAASRLDHPRYLEGGFYVGGVEIPWRKVSHTYPPTVVVYPEGYTPLSPLAHVATPFMRHPVTIPPGAVQMGPYAMSFPFGAPQVHGVMPPMSPCIVEDLNELMRQRQLISAAIHQIEQELARIANQQRAVECHPVAAVQNTQKVHLATEYFEAHCDSVRCVGKDASRLLLEGNVRLVCKKTSHAIRIEAPSVLISLKDGTFTIQPPLESAAVPVRGFRDSDSGSYGNHDVADYYFVDVDVAPPANWTPVPTMLRTYRPESTPQYIPPAPASPRPWSAPTWQVTPPQTVPYPVVPRPIAPVPHEE
jgi:hypothetical protein